MDYYENILKESWLGGEGKISLKQRLYLFVKYGSAGLIAS